MMIIWYKIMNILLEKQSRQWMTPLRGRKVWPFDPIDNHSGLRLDRFALNSVSNNVSNTFSAESKTFVAWFIFYLKRLNVQNSTGPVI